MPHCLSMLLMNLSLTFQLVSAYWPLLCFKVDGHACSWLLREWVATVSCCCVSSLLTMSVSAFRKWVTAMPCCASSSLITPILDYSACEWLLGLSDFRLADHVCSWLFSLWVAALPCCISTLLIIANHILPRMWVVAPLSCISCLLRMLIFYSPESEFWPCFSAFQACWQCLLFALQQVSHCHPYCISDLLMMLALVCSVGEWFPCIAAFQVSWWSLSGIFRKWVAVCIAVFYTCWECSACLLTDHTYPLSTSMWVHSLLLSLLMVSTFHSSACEYSSSAHSSKYLTPLSDKAYYITVHYSKCAIFVFNHLSS